MDPDPSSSLLILALSLFASAFFSGMEMAFVASSRLQTEMNAQQSLRGRIVAMLSSRPQLFIATMLVGNNLALVICGMESGALISEWLFDVSSWQTASQPVLVLATQNTDRLPKAPSLQALELDADNADAYMLIGDAIAGSSKS